MTTPPRLHALAAACCLLCSIGAHAQAACPTATDRFGRSLGEHPLMLPDWEGYMANPAVRIELAPPAQARFPLTVTLRSIDPLVHFDLPGEVNEHGATREVTFDGPAPRTVYVSAFPQRVKQRLRSRIGLRAQGLDDCAFAVEIMPVETMPSGARRTVTVDYAHDTSGFFADPARRAVFEQAVGDWTFFIDGAQDTPVPQAGEITYLFGPGSFRTGRWVLNSQPYRGFLLYAHGIETPELRSGGAPSVHGRGADALGRPRSGSVQMEVRGNYGTHGWLPPDLSDRDWWRASNLTEEPTDLYSVMHHEIGHALFFNSGWPGFVRRQPLPGPVAGRSLTPDDVDHFTREVDPVSRRGLFGNEYHGRMPDGRWLITRADLLAIAALGWKLRPVAALLPLSLDGSAPPPALRGQPYRHVLAARGGVPVYDWVVESGALPPGLALERYSGALHGRPRHAGSWTFSVTVRDSDDEEATRTASYTIEVDEPFKAEH
jgi:hypothetical protein